MGYSGLIVAAIALLTTSSECWPQEEDREPNWNCSSAPAKKCGNSSAPGEVVEVLGVDGNATDVTSAADKENSTNFWPTSPNAIELSTEAPTRAGFLDWLLGLLGLNPSDDNSNLQPPKDCPKCKCGLAYFRKRIVGGMETQVNEFPWVTLLTRYNRFYCGASLINDKYIVSASHCVTGFAKESIGAIFLDHDRLTASETKVITRKISKIIAHRGYNSGGVYNNDIALLKLSEPVPITGLLKPVCLPAYGRSYSNEKGLVTGWGATSENGPIAGRLMEVEVSIISNKDCRKTGYRNKITDNMMCAGHPDGGKDACQGDSGGPLLFLNDTKYDLVGVVSWGEGCAQKAYPGVYTRVNRYLTWILTNTIDACYCV